jgi:L-seryl-tRNA(Ser) seleniumtransferase
MTEITHITSQPADSTADDPYAAFGVRPLVNACGIYTDLGGSTLDEQVWTALGAVNRTWASMIDLLDATGRRIAELVGAEGARVVPGASAAIALATAACIARRGDDLVETLPLPGGEAPREVVLQVAHRYKYTRCALLGGGRIREVGAPDGTGAEQLEAALADGAVAAVLHPAHLEDAPGALSLEAVARIAHAHDVPVIVDAAYQVFPVELIGSYGARGGDLTCISSKYFGGPNGGGFVAGRRDLVQRVADVDFTRFESGPLLTFGRAMKLDRTTVVATTLTLERWLEADHDARWDGYRRLADGLLAAFAARGVGAGARACCFTLDERIVQEPVNAVAMPVPDPAALADALAAGTPSVRCVPFERELLFCFDCVREHEVEAIAEAVAAVV